MRSFTTDGNFTADHIKQKRDQDDVWLADGEGIMTAREPYTTHLKTAKPPKEVFFFLMMTGSITDPTDRIFRNILVNLWSEAFGRFWMPTRDRESKMSLASAPMLALVTGAFVPQAVLTLSKVKSSRQWTIHYRRPASTRIACTEFANYSTYTILNANTA